MHSPVRRTVPTLIRCAHGRTLREGDGAGQPLLASTPGVVGHRSDASGMPSPSVSVGEGAGVTVAEPGSRMIERPPWTTVTTRRKDPGVA